MAVKNEVVVDLPLQPRASEVCCRKVRMEDMGCRGHCLWSKWWETHRNCLLNIFPVFFIQRCPCPASFLMEGGLFLISEGMEPRPRADGWVPAHRFTAPGRPCIIYKCSEFLVPLSFLIQFRRWLIKRESRTQEGAQDSPSQGSLSPEVRAASRQERGSPCPSPVLPVPLASTCW